MVSMIHFSWIVLLLSDCHPGLFSSLMRDLSEKTSDSPKWIVLDGDIDPMWIESLNTVMDDNKVSYTSKTARITRHLLDLGVDSG